MKVRLCSWCDKHATHRLTMLAGEDGPTKVGVPMWRDWACDQHTKHYAYAYKVEQAS